MASRSAHPNGRGATSNDLAHRPRAQRGAHVNMVTASHPAEHRYVLRWRLFVATGPCPRRDPLDSRSTQILARSVASLIRFRASHDEGGGAVRVNVEVRPHQRCVFRPSEHRIAHYGDKRSISETGSSVVGGCDLRSGICVAPNQRYCCLLRRGLACRLTLRCSSARSARVRLAKRPGNPARSGNGDADCANGVPVASHRPDRLRKSVVVEVAGCVDPTESESPKRSQVAAPRVVGQAVELLGGSELKVVCERSRRFFSLHDRQFRADVGA